MNSSPKKERQHFINLILKDIFNAYEEEVQRNLFLTFFFFFNFETFKTKYLFLKK